MANELSNEIIELCKKAAENKGIGDDALEPVRHRWERLVQGFSQLEPKKRVRAFSKITAVISRYRGDVRHRSGRDVTFNGAIYKVFDILASHLQDLHPHIKTMVDFRRFAEEESGCLIFETLTWEMLAKWAEQKVGLPK